MSRHAYSNTSGAVWTTLNSCDITMYSHDIIIGGVYNKSPPAIYLLHVESVRLNILTLQGRYERLMRA